MPLKARQPTMSPDSSVPLPLLTAADNAPYMRMGIYGKSGVGKTLLAATACEVEALSPVLFIDCGESSDTILGEPRFASIKIFRPRTLQQFTDVYNWLAPVEWGGEGHVADFKTVVIDEFDELHTTTMRETMAGAVKLNSNQDYYVPSPREWGIVRSKLLELFDWMKVLPANLIWICVPYMKEDPITAREQLNYGLPGKLADDIAKRLSLSVYLEVIDKKVKEGVSFVETSRRVAHFKATGKFLAKVRGESRAARLGSELEDPTMPRIYELWK